jgi:cytochrome c-type biogenesis protein
MLTTLVFATLAGTLSILSPCVLPILPLVVAGAAGESRAGPVALAAGLATSFCATGLLLATVGFAAGIDAGPVRAFGGLLMAAFGLAMLVPRLQDALAAGLAPLGGGAARLLEGRAFAGNGGQFALGGLLGLVWSPCVGPTLGSASLLAARGENLGQVGLTMAAFGIGAGLPLAALGALPRERMTALRARMGAAGQGGKAVLGALLLAAGALVLSGLDKRVEAWFVDAMPDWLVALTTRF